MEGNGMPNPKLGGCSIIPKGEGVLSPGVSDSTSVSKAASATASAKFSASRASRKWTSFSGSKPGGAPIPLAGQDCIFRSHKKPSSEVGMKRLVSMNVFLTE